MGQEYTIPLIINFEKIAQFKITGQQARNKIFNTRTFDPDYVRKIYMLRKNVEFAYGQNPGGQKTRQVADYLFALIRPYIVNVATIVISNPSNQSVNVGGNATFSVSVIVSNGAPFTIQWYRNGVAIPGATSLQYTLNNAQLSDSGAQFNAVAIAPGVGTATSNKGLLTVTAIILAYWYFSDTDPFPTLELGLDPFVYNVQQQIAHNQPIVITYPAASVNNKFNLLKYPVTENDKTVWKNTQQNFGTIPDQQMRDIISFGGFKYICSRTAMSLDGSATTLTYS